MSAFEKLKRGLVEFTSRFGCMFMHRMPVGFKRERQEEKEGKRGRGVKE